MACIGMHAGVVVKSLLAIGVVDVDAGGDGILGIAND